MGDIYPYVVKQLGCNPEDILHIGDNYKSDVLNSKGNGLLSYFYEKSRDRAINSYWFNKEKFHKLINNNKCLNSSFYLATIINQYYCDPQDNQTSDEEDFWYNFGFKNVGILFLSFMNWLLDATTKDGIDKIFFLSRDGYIMHKVYYLLAGYRDNTPRADYMYASRRALNIPSIFELNDVAMNFLASGTSILTVSQFLERINIDPNQYRQEIQSAGFIDSNQEVKTKEDYINLNKLYKLLSSEIRQLACSERINLLNYLKSIGLLDKKRIAIVDIGWNGTMQYSLSTMLKKNQKNIEIKGYYFGTLIQAQQKRKQGMDISSYLIDLGKPKYYKNLVKLCLPFLEFIHAAPHGSVHNYACIGQEVKPVLDEHDLSLQDRKKALLIQKGALEFISQYQKYIQNYPFIKPLKKMATQPLYRVIKNPTLYEAEKLGDIEHSESFGNINDKRYIAKPPTDIPLLLLRFDKLFSSFKSAYWRKGYIKRLLANIYSF